MSNKVVPQNSPRQTWALVVEHVGPASVARQAVDWWEASAEEAVAQGAHAEEALRMLERACGLADTLADYYRHNQQARQ